MDDTEGIYPMTDESYTMFTGVLADLQSAYRTAQEHTQSIVAKRSRCRLVSTKHHEYTAAYEMAVQVENAIYAAIGALEVRYQTEAARYRREHSTPNRAA